MMIPNDFVNFSEWANSLLIDFSSASTIPYSPEEDNWKEWGNIVAGSPEFSVKGVPTTESFPNWKEWGIIVYSTMVK